MRNDVATKAMPDFRQRHFLEILSVLANKHLDLASGYLMSLTALTLGIQCNFTRLPTQDSDGSNQSKKSLPVCYWLSSSGQSIAFNGSIPISKIDRGMVNLTRNKAATRRVLSKAGIKTAIGGLAWSDNMQVLDTLAEHGVKRVLVKPNEGSLSRGILANVTIEDARHHIAARPEEKFVVEQYIVGTEYRIYTVGGEFAACFARLRDHLVGDGKRTIEQLLKRRHMLQLSNPHCRERAKANPDNGAFLKASGVKFDRVPEKGEFIWLSDDPIPKSRDGVYEPTGVSDVVRKLAGDVAQAVNGDCVAIDLIDRGPDGTYVLEVNAKPNITASCFPLNTPPNLRFPEAVLRNSFPMHKDNVRRVKSYDFARLLRDFQKKTDVLTFDASDYVAFEE